MRQGSRAHALRSHTPAPRCPRHSPQLFIFILCQSSLRLIIQKALNLGMGREFQVRSRAADRAGLRRQGRRAAVGEGGGCQAQCLSLDAPRRRRPPSPTCRRTLCRPCPRAHPLPASSTPRSPPLPRRRSDTHFVAFPRDFADVPRRFCCFRDRLPPLWKSSLQQLQHPVLYMAGRVRAGEAMLLCADVWALAGQFGNQAGGGGGALCVGTELTQRWGGRVEERHRGVP